MLFKALSSTASLLSLLSLLTSQAVAQGALKDIRIHSDKADCTGPYALRRLYAGECCSPIHNFRSWVMSKPSSGDRTVIFTQKNCGGSSLSANGGTCAAFMFYIPSIQWVGSNAGKREAREQIAPAVNATAEAEGVAESKCVEPAAYGYEDEEGNAIEAVIPDHRKRDLSDALADSDHSAFKALIREYAGVEAV